MSYVTERRLEEKIRRRAEILDAAEAVAARFGWENTTMDQVARKARLSRALVYVYFTDKTDLTSGIMNADCCNSQRSRASACRQAGADSRARFRSGERTSISSRSITFTPT